jgi:hypothetical protein
MTREEAVLHLLSLFFSRALLAMYMDTAVYQIFHNTTQARCARRVFVAAVNCSSRARGRERGRERGRARDLTSLRLDIFIIIHYLLISTIKWSGTLVEYILPVSLSGPTEQSNNSTKVRSIVGE